MAVERIRQLFKVAQKAAQQVLAALAIKAKAGAGSSWLCGGAVLHSHAVLHQAAVESGLINGLGEVAIHAGFQAAAQVFFLCLSGEGDDG